MPQLTRDEKIELIAELRVAIADEITGSVPDGGECPRCCASAVRKGRGRDGGQRWICRDCGRTFSAKTMGLLASSKLPPVHLDDVRGVHGFMERGSSRLLYLLATMRNQ